MPGNNTITETVLPINGPVPGQGTITFKANGQEVSTNFSTEPGILSGLFSFVFDAVTLGIILIAVIIVIVLAGMLATKPPAAEAHNQPWTGGKSA